MRRAAIIVLCCLLPACVSFYGRHEYVIVSTLKGSREPAAEYPVRVIYPYDNYGVVYILNAPSPVDLMLDENGRLELKIAEFSNPQIVVGSTIFKLDEEMLRNGGTPSKFPYSDTDEYYERFRETYDAYELPSRRYPEVDIEIIKEPEN